MELIFIWISDYKNIKNQHFQISSRFTIFFDEIKKNLEITDNKEKFISDFFRIHNNDLNFDITAIVGENGTGKSNLLSIISNYIEDSHKHCKVLKLYYNDNNENFYYYSNDEKLEINFLLNKKIVEITKIEDYNNYIYFSEAHSNNSLNNTSIDNISFWKNLKDQYEYYFKNDFYPENLEFNELINQVNLKNRLIEINLIKNLGFVPGIKVIPKNILISFNLETLDNKPEDNKEIKHFYLNSSEELILISIIEMIIKAGNISDEVYDDYESFSDFYNSNINITLKKLRIEAKKMSDDFIKIFELVNKFTELYKTKKITVSKNFKKISIPIKEMDEKFINLISEINSYVSFDELKPIHIDWDRNLSSGEESMLRFFSSLYFSLEKNRTLQNEIDNFIILVDELENYIHPTWQAKIIKLIIDFFHIIKKNYTNLNSIQIIVTTHSPFIISDLTEDRVIYLKREEKDGNTINKTDKIKIKSFGANIHSLLSNSFFMNSHVGEFAKIKLSNILKDLNENQNITTLEKNNIYNIINNIGEDFLREKLLKLYEKKFNLNYNEKLQLLEKEYELNKEKLKKLYKYD